MTQAVHLLPNRRVSHIVRFELADGYAVQSYTVQYSSFADGTLGEIFMEPDGTAGKPGMPLSNMAKDMSVLFSIARRYGAPVEVIQAALSQEASGKMLGPLGEFLRLHAAGET